MKVGILGGGLSGLSLGYLLNKKGIDNEVLEKESECGGLCRTNHKDGYSYDCGAHIIFSKDEEVLKFMVDVLGENAEKKYRNNKVLYRGIFVKYPFENGLSELPNGDNFECLKGYIDAFYNPKPFGNFKEWIYSVYGKGISEKYLIPYNEKIWKYDLSDMGTEWIERLPRPPMDDVIKSSIGIETEGYKHQLYFYYPKKGGIQSLVDAIGKGVDVRKNTNVEKVEKVGDGWMVNGIYAYDRIVSTIPIFNMVEALRNVPEGVMRAVKELRYNSIIILLIGLKKPHKSNMTAVYIPSRDILPHRICFNAYLSESMMPDGKGSIMAEITCLSTRLWETNDNVVVVNVLDGLRDAGILDPKDVDVVDIKRIKYAYIIYDTDYSKNIKVVYDYFKDIGIELCGRFSEFKYLNMDAVIRSAMNTSKRLI